MAGVQLPSNSGICFIRMFPAYPSITKDRTPLSILNMIAECAKMFGYLLPHEKKEIWLVKHDRQSHLYVTTLTPIIGEIGVARKFLCLSAQYRCVQNNRSGEHVWKFVLAGLLYRLSSNYSGLRALENIRILPFLVFALASIPPHSGGLVRSTHPLSGKHNWDELEAWLNVAEYNGEIYI